MLTHRLKTLLALSLALSLGLTACTPASPTSTNAQTPTPGAEIESDPEPEETAGPVPEDVLVIYSGRSEALVAPVIERFKALHPGIAVALKAGSNSELANALLEERANPQADLFITTEILTVQKMASEGVLQPYRPPNASRLPAEYVHPGGLWTGVTLRARVIMYNTDLVAPEDVPQSIFDLTNPKWSGQVAAAGSTNGSMQAQAAALRQLIGDDETEAWLRGLVANDVTFFGGHTDVRNAVGAGEFQLGLVNHYYYHLQKAQGSPVGVVYPDQAEGQIGLIVNATAIGLVQGARHPEAAKAFIDFVLSEEGQELFAELNFEYPLLPGVTLHADVAPLSDFRLARFDLVAAADSLDSTLDMLERVGIQ